jgi:nucleoside-diphosphate-sugar epimerase
VPTTRLRPLVLVTGASGFIGSALLRRLAQDFDLGALDREAPKRGWIEAEVVPLLDTLPKMVEALKVDPAGWYRAHKLELPVSLEAAAKAKPGPPAK